jgi:transposase InsO family protein
MLGYDNVKQRTVSRYLRKFRSNHPAKKKQQLWRTFLNNHRDVISAIDFFVVPNVRFGMLYVFFIIDHARREIVHVNVTQHPTENWVKQQLREAFPFDSVPHHAPWQNGVAERWLLSARTELLNHVIIFSEEHLIRLLKEYLQYYHYDRCHLSLDRNTPMGRHVESKPSQSSKVTSLPRLGGLHHKYEWRKAA